MYNFIELHLPDGSPITYNVSKIINYFPARQAAVEKYGYKCHIVSSEHTDGGCANVKESYEEVTAKIKRCTSAMVIE
jgi:hypothetical protein